ncbi:tyrosine-type recombinase/integrase [Nocardia bovistercoris]|uniref:Tyrosine-type recombinase/integrase n=1 Tax=Nocardia bovistercoris TaxID=2785916 RepID=A0A931IL66_9NOCA|nr:tyrosine-type recombinase/integrase [Nocardia bovistercoris]MBH0781548.1 tyrosine-type recombinase/integrase [Nocardia bovistercoris]
MHRSRLDGAARTAGLEGVTPHELRHAAASPAVSRGASVLAMQRMLGHAKPSATLNFYSDLFDDDVAARLDAARTSFPLRTNCVRNRGPWARVS